MKVCALEVRAGEVRAMKVHAGEVCAGELRADYPRPGDSHSVRGSQPSNYATNSKTCRHLWTDARRALVAGSNLC